MKTKQSLMVRGTLRSHCYLFSALYPILATTTTSVWRLFFQDNLGKPVPEEARDDEVSRWQWHQLDHMLTICLSLQTDNHTNTSSLNFHRPDALLDIQTTVSKH